MRIALAVVALLLGRIDAAPAQPVPRSCQTFTRASTAAPEIVRGWLAHSGDERVSVCTPRASDAATEAVRVYRGESSVDKRGALCSYTSHLLTTVGEGAASRLQRYERADAVVMALATGACPPPDAAVGRYTTTYDLSAAAFESIMAFWAAAAASAPSFDRELACCGVDGSAEGAPVTASANATRARLRATIAAGRMKAAAVTRIVRVTGPVLRRRYALFVIDPDSQPAGSAVYVIYLSKWLAGPYRITGINEVAN